MDIYQIDGTLVPASEATVSVRDRGFMYGDAAFETLRVYGGEPFEWSAHAERLQHTCETLEFARAMPPFDDLSERVRETVSANDFDDAYVRLSITRGEQPASLEPDPRVDPTVVVVVAELPRGGLEGSRTWDEPAGIETVDRPHISDAALPADIRTHNHLHGILARLELRAESGAGDSSVPNPTDDKPEWLADDKPEGPADEALLLDEDGFVTEGTTSNLFFVADGTLKTPVRTVPLLPGVTRSVVLELARKEELPVETGRFDVASVLRSDEVFLTNSTWEIRPVRKLDGNSFDVGPVTRLLQRLFDERVEARHYSAE